MCFEFVVASDFISGRTLGDPGRFILRPVMEAVNPGEVAFREQLGLGLQPVLHIVPGLRALVHITEVRPSGHFVR